jgi:three-Cys-motif partner protein
MNEDFFSIPLEQSKIKSQIVSKYFDAWARIIASHAEKIAYVDLFAGQGYYQDGTESTPLLILKKAIDNPKVAEKLITEFNDKNTEYIESLRKAINQLENIKKLANPPKISNLVISTEISRKYMESNLPPTLFFLDPWGYKGLSMDLVRGAVKDWASECLLFFNYDRINRDLENPLASDNINELFRKPRADKLRTEIRGKPPYEREEIIIQEFCGALEQLGGKYVLPFCFLKRSKDKTSHYLIHITKNLLGFGIMKEIMGEYSLKDSDGVPTYTFDPKPATQLMLNFNRPITELMEKLLSEFQGQTLIFEDIYNKYHGRTRFIKDNFKDALIKLEEKYRITVDIPREKRFRKGKLTLGPKRIITFLR